jgi:hypothetical protein
MRALASHALLALTFGLGACGSAGWTEAWRSGEKVAPEQIRTIELRLLAGADPEGAAAGAERILADAKRTEEERQRAFHVLLLASDMVGAFERPIPWLAELPGWGRDAEAAEILAPQLDRVWGRLDGQSPLDPNIVAALERAAGEAVPVGHVLARHEVERHRLQRARLAGEVSPTAFVTMWRVSAPWGRAPLLDMREPLGPETRPLKAIETTGAGWAGRTVPTRQAVFSDGEVMFFELGDEPGVGFAEAVVTVSAGNLLFGLETNRLAIVHVDGRPIGGRTEAGMSNFVPLFASPRATPGEVRLTVKFASADGRGFFRLAVLPADAAVASGPAVRAARSIRPDRPDAAIRGLLHLQRLIARPWRDLRGARSLLNQLARDLGEGPVVDFFRYRLDFVDADLGQGGRREALRRHLERLQQQWPANASLRRELARIEREELRTDAAMKLLMQDPSDPRSRIELLDIQRQRGWEAEALAHARALVETHGASPRVLQEAIDTLATFGRVTEARLLAQRLAHAYPMAGAGRYAAVLLDAGDAEGAAAWHRRMFALEPQVHAHLRAEVQALRVAGRDNEALEALEAFLANRPGDVWALGERARIAVGCVLKQPSALARLPRTAPGCPPYLDLLDATLRADPDFQPLIALGALLNREAENLDDAPEDVAPMLAAARAGPLASEGPLANHPVVTILDRGHIIVRPDGTSIELRHRVRQANTRSGADALGDIRIPEGARLLIARTLKADGRVVYPEVTPGKSELSLSELQPGDAVETAWVTRGRTRPEEGGYLTSLAFAQPGVPTIAIEHVVAVAPPLRLDVSAWNGASDPVVTEESDGQRLYVWRVGTIAAPIIVPREPNAASARSFVPFADLRLAPRDADPRREREDALLEVARAWANRIDALSTLGVRGEALVESLRAKAGGDTTRFSEAALAWVREAFEATETFNQFETPVERAIGAARGNRALVLHALLAQDDPTVSMILCAPRVDGPAPDDEVPVANANRFFYPLVRSSQRLIDPARMHVAGSDLADELRGARCLEPAAARGRVLSFATIPATPREAPAFDIRIDAELAANGDARMTLVGQFGGPAASGLRQVWLAQDDTRRRILWEQWIGGLFTGASLVEATTKRAADDARPMEVRLVFDVPGWARAEAGALVIPRLVGRQMLAGDFTSTPDLQDLVALPARQTPMRTAAHSERVRFSVRPPSGWRATGDAATPREPAPIAFPMAAPLVAAVDAVDVDDGALHIDRTTVSRPGRIAPSEYADLRAAIAAMLDGRMAPIRFERR